MKRESIFKEKVLADLKLIPACWATKIQQQSIRGTPDILVCLAGLFVALELKVSGGRLDPLQEYVLTQISEHAWGRSYVVTPATWDSVREALSDLAAERIRAYQTPLGCFLR